MCRRICVLRERGESMEAARLETDELAELLAALRAGGETDDAIQQRLTTLFAIEEERVADAAVLAELLLPALRGHATTPDAASGASEPARPDIAGEKNASSRPSAATAPAAPPEPRKRSTDIATFIDEMLAQESTPARRAS